MIAFDVRHYESIGSTNDEAQRLARDGAGHGTVVCAREQTTGRGRLARRWHSPVGNLYISILLRPGVPAAAMPQLGFVAALAIADTVDRCVAGAMKVELKWPNDVLVNGAKISGILLETVDAAVVVGLGVNVQHVPSGTPYPVTSLAAHRGDAAAPSVQFVLDTLLELFGRRYCEWERHGFEPMRAAWLARAHPPGSPLRVLIGDRTTSGNFAGLAEGGALLIETLDGIVRVTAGEVT